MVAHGKAFKFELVSPERILFQGTANMVVLPAVTGSLGVLANHAPTVIALTTGIIDVYNNDHISQRLFVGGGFANITGTACLTMANDAIRVEDIVEEDLEQYIKDVELAVQKAISEEERTALVENANMARAKIDIIKLFQPEKPQL